MLGAFARPNQGSYDESHDSPVYFQFYTQSKISKASDELPPGHYTIKVEIAAADARPKIRVIKLMIPDSFNKEPEVQVSQ